MDLTTILVPNLNLIPFSPDNQPRGKISRKVAGINDAMRLTQEDHDTIMDEIQLRDRLEYDPMMVMDGDDEEEDLESESEGEEG